MSSEVVELGLRRMPAPPDSPGSTREAAASAPSPAPLPVPHANSIKGLAEAFLKLMADFAPDAADQDARAFAAELKDYRDQIALSAHDQETRRLAAASVRACEQFLKKSRQYYQAREKELKEMIAIIRDLAAHIGGDNSEFNATLRATSGKFQGLTQLEDIRELKKQLSEEATALQKTIEEKEKRDEETFSALNDRVNTLQANLAQAEHEASLDPLTRLANRATFDRSLSRLIRQSRASKTPMTLAMLDIDRFKAINDKHGHPIGDRVILCVAQWVSAAVRHTDLVARYGGEEFVVVLSDADLAAAEARFTAVLRQIASRSFEYTADGESRSVRFTVSCGIAQLASSDAVEDLISRADRALYEAKNSGGNRAVARKRSMLGGLFS